MPSMKNPDAFGSPIGNSRWLKGEPTLIETPMQPVRVIWPCPMDECAGEMEFNGCTWPMSIPGYHHSCSKCGFTAAIAGKKYPTIEYREI